MRSRAAIAVLKATDLGSSAAAATVLGIAAQMVGRHVRAVEDRIGTPLLRRSTPRQSLAEAGRFHERCRVGLAEVEAAEASGEGARIRSRFQVDDGRVPANAAVAGGASSCSRKRCRAPLAGGRLVPALADQAAANRPMVQNRRPHPPKSWAFIDHIVAAFRLAPHRRKGGVAEDGALDGGGLSDQPRSARA